jgi:hypothetical protein
LQRRARSILDELDTLLTHRDRENLVESRAAHVISGAINLINYIYTNSAGFTEYLNKLDQWRGMSWRTTFPDVEQYYV